MEPETFMFVEMDSMDQAKTALPHFAKPCKLLNETAVVKMHVTAARVVGVGMQQYLYTNNIPHDANCTVTILHR